MFLFGMTCLAHGLNDSFRVLGVFKGHVSLGIDHSQPPSPLKRSFRNFNLLPLVLSLVSICDLTFPGLIWSLEIKGFLVCIKGRLKCRFNKVALFIDLCTYKASIFLFESLDLVMFLVMLFLVPFVGGFGVKITPTPFKHFGMLLGPLGLRKLRSFPPP